MNRRRDDDERFDRYQVLGVGLYLVMVLGAVWLLFGCATPKVEYVPFEVRVPVPVPCAAEAPAEPAWATKGLPHATPENVDQHVDALLRERHQRMGYEAQLRAATEGCR